MSVPMARGVLGSRRRGQPVVPGRCPLVGRALGEHGFVFARRVGGEPALPQDGPWVFLPPSQLVRHVLVCGATGFGKTETLLRLAWTVAKTSDAPVFYLDGKGDLENAERFVGLMTDAGRETRVFPNEPFDGWRGGPSDVHGRLMEIIDYADEGPASWYRDIAKTVLRLVCEQPAGPPRSSGELLGRMDLGLLKRAHPGCSAVAALTAQQVAHARLRYEAFFGQARGLLDGGWAWEDASAGYLMLNSLTLHDETAGLSRFLLEDFSHYFTVRKPREQFSVLIVDEFSSLARSSSMAARVEQARGFNTALILAPQVVEGMGGEAEAARILGSIETVIAHRVNSPDEIVALAGTRKVPAFTTRLAEDGMRRERTVRLEHQLTIDPNHLRKLDPGLAYIISRGRAMKAQIQQAPPVRGALPVVEQVSNVTSGSKETNSPGSTNRKSVTRGEFPAGELPF